MNSPYNGDFKVTQTYKGKEHDGLDLVGIDSKTIHSTINGVVEYAGWENPYEHSQGFGQYVKIIDNVTGYDFYYGHLSKISVKVGQSVIIGDVIGTEGNTGYSTGPHCHYCIRKNGKGTHINVSDFSGIPNKLGTYNDGFAPSAKVPEIELKVNGKTVYKK